MCSHVELSEKYCEKHCSGKNFCDPIYLKRVAIYNMDQYGLKNPQDLLRSLKVLEFSFVWAGSDVLIMLFFNFYKMSV